MRLVFVRTLLFLLPLAACSPSSKPTSEADDQDAAIGDGSIDSADTDSPNPTDADRPDAASGDAEPRDAGPGPNCADLEPIGALSDPLAELAGPYARCKTVGQGQVVHHDWTPNGDIIVSTTAGQVVRVDGNGEQLWTATTQLTRAAAFAVSPDARYVGVADGRSVRVLAADSGELVQVIEFEHFVLSISFGPDGCTMATGHLTDRGLESLVFSALATGTKVRGMVVDEMVPKIKYSPDGKHVAAIVKGNGHTLDQPTPIWVEIRRADTGEQVARTAAENFVWVADNVLVLGRENGEVARFELGRGETQVEALFEPARARGGSPRTVEQLLSLGDGRVLVQTSTSAGLQLLQVATLTLESSITAVTADTLRLSHDGRHLSATRQGLLFNRNLNTDDPEVELLGILSAPIDLSGGGLVAVGRSDGRSAVLDTSVGAEPRLVNVPGRLSAVAHNGSVAAVVSGNQLTVFEPTTGERLLDEIGPIASSGLVAISPDGTRVAVAIGASSVQVWRMADGTLEWVLPEVPINQNSAIFAGITDLEFSPDGTHLAAVGGGFYQSRVWALEDGAETSILGKAASLAWSADSAALFLLPHQTANIRRVAVPSFEIEELPIEVSGDGRQLAWTPDGLVVVGGRFTEILDPQTGEQIQQLPGARAVASTPSGERLVTVTSSGTVDVYCAQ